MPWMLKLRVEDLFCHRMREKCIAGSRRRSGQQQSAFGAARQALDRCTYENGIVLVDQLRHAGILLDPAHSRAILRSPHKERQSDSSVIGQLAGEAQFHVWA